METVNQGWYEGKLSLLSEELMRIESGIAPDYVQDKDLFGKEVLRSEMIKDEIRDIKIVLCV